MVVVVVNVQFNVRNPSAQSTIAVQSGGARYLRNGSSNCTGATVSQKKTVKEK